MKFPSTLDEFALLPRKPYEDTKPSDTKQLSRMYKASQKSFFARPDGLKIGDRVKTMVDSFSCKGEVFTVVGLMAFSQGRGWHEVSDRSDGIFSYILGVNDSDQRYFVESDTWWKFLTVL